MTRILPYVLEVDGQEVIVTPDPAHEFTATTEQVALGYGVSADVIRKHKERQAEELTEGKHFLSSVTNSHAQPGRGAQTLTLWTKRGIVRLGFFIRSKRARLFRDMAEDLVIAALEAPQPTAALVSLRLIGEALGCTPKSAANRVNTRKLRPTHHYFEPLKHAPTYLYPLEAVQAVWPGAVFQPFVGEAFAGIAPVAQALAAQSAGKIAKQHRPRLIPTDTDTEQLARRLLSLEAQKREVLRELAALA